MSKYKVEWIEKTRFVSEIEAASEQEAIKQMATYVFHRESSFYDEFEISPEVTTELING